MEKFLSNNLLAIISCMISVVSLGISFLSLSLNNRNSRLASYSMRGNYSVSFRKESWKEKILSSPAFSMKIFNSISSEVLRFEYKIQIIPITGGVRRAQLFSGIEKGNYIGIDRSGPVIINKVNQRKKFPRKYAYESLHGFTSTPFYSYFSVRCRGNNEQHYNDRALNRYHQYLEVTDFNGNTEIWYFSFSLYLSNLEMDYDFSKGWKKFRSPYFKYYKVSEIIIFSPKDLLKNLRSSLMPTMNLAEVRGCEEEWQSSDRLAREGFSPFDDDLQLYELREYYQFHEIIKKHI